MTVNRTDRGHRQVVQQDDVRTGLWWVSCHCPSGRDGIVMRRRVAGGSWCPSQAAALELARWHARGEHGPPPGTVTQLDLFDTATGGPPCRS